MTWTFRTGAACVALAALALAGCGGSGPIPDGTVLPTGPVAEILAGRYLKVPVLAGNTRDEGKPAWPAKPVFAATPSAKQITVE